ncbi:K(+)-transporting ATPase subunit F [Acidisoma sp. 7E03]
MPRSAIASRCIMLADILGAVTALLLMVYLVWALVRPEDF